MRDFVCPQCGQQLTFENSVCLGCGSSIGFDLDTRAFALTTASGVVYGTGGRDGAKGGCANLDLAGCNWLAPVPSHPNGTAGGSRGLCRSCSLTRTRPADTDLGALAAFAEAEAAKRRLVLELTELGLPIHGRDVDPEAGLCFDLLSSAQVQVMTGHEDGVITLDLAEGDDVHREQLRASMAEPYRTMLGHFRHETGHYYYDTLVGTETARTEFEALFGDPEADYQAALDRHYHQGPPPGWQDTYVSAYATMHPTEDWAETFAHYLHIRDTLDTAATFGFAPAEMTLATPLAGDVGFARIIELWLPLAWSLNMINRSMGHPDLYPFVLPAAALDKMRFVHQLVSRELVTGGRGV